MLSITYELADGLTDDAPILMSEGRGWINYELSRGLFVPEGVAALNSISSQLLAGGQWFQLWRGDVVSMGSPERRGTGHARLHRGSVVQERPRRPRQR